MRCLKQTSRRRLQPDRQGSATVEFALVAPLLIALILGGIETGFNFDSTHKMYACVRQSGRLAAMDNAEKLLSGQSANDKVILDIQNALTAEGLPGNQATVTITHASGASEGDTFDLSSSANDLKYFRLKVTIPYSAVNTDNFLPSTMSQLSASVVFRKGKTSLVN